MEIRETAACGITERQFAIEMDAEELPDIYRIFLFIKAGAGYYDEEAQQDLVEQMSYIIGPEVEDEPDEGANVDGIAWHEEDEMYQLVFQETNSQYIYRILTAVAHPGEGFDQDLNARLAKQILEMAPSILENLPVINR